MRINLNQIETHNFESNPNVVRFEKLPNKKLKVKQLDLTDKEKLKMSYKSKRKHDRTIMEF
jgi:hypothetical protein